MGDVMSPFGTQSLGKEDPQAVWQVLGESDRVFFQGTQHETPKLVRDEEGQDLGNIEVV